MQIEQKYWNKIQNSHLINKQIIKFIEKFKNRLINQTITLKIDKYYKTTEEKLTTIFSVKEIVSQIDLIEFSGENIPSNLIPIGSFDETASILFVDIVKSDIWFYDSSYNEFFKTQLNITNLDKSIDYVSTTEKHLNKLHPNNTFKALEQYIILDDNLLEIIEHLPSEWKNRIEEYNGGIITIIVNGYPENNIIKNKKVRGFLFPVYDNSSNKTIKKTWDHIGKYNNNSDEIFVARSEWGIKEGLVYKNNKWYWKVSQSQYLLVNKINWDYHLNN